VTKMTSDGNKTAELVRRAAILVLGIAVVVHVAILGSGYIRLWVSRAWRNRSVDVMHRSTSFLLGERASRYMDFLAASVPTDGSLVLPEGAGEYSEQNILQFYLMPPAVIGCGCGSEATEPTPACLQCLLERGRYVPAIGNFPLPGVLEGNKRYLAYPEDTAWFHGLWLGADGATGSAQLGVGETKPAAMAAALDLAIYCGLAILGGLVWVVFACSHDRLRGLLLGIPAASGLLTLAVFVLGWAGLRVTTGLYLVAWTALVLAALALRKWTTRNRAEGEDTTLRGEQGRASQWERWLRILGWIAIGSLLTVAALISVARAYSIYDAIANWAIKGYAIAYEGTVLAGANWGGHGLAYPQNIHLLIAFFRIAEGDVLPASKLLDPVFALALGVGLYEFWRWRGVPRALATFAVAVLISTPIIYQHITYGYANFMFASYVVLGVTQFVRAVHEVDSRRAVLSGLLMGLAAWTRPEGGALGACVLLALAVYSLATREDWKPVVATLLPLAGIWAIWLSFGGRHHQASDQVGRVLKELTAGLSSEPLRWDIVRAFWDFTTRRSIEPSTWGLLLPLAVLLLLASLLVRGRGRARAGEDRTMALAASVMVFFCLGIVGLAFYYYKSTLLLTDSLDRDSFPAAICCWVWAIATLGDAGALRSRMRLSGKPPPALAAARD